jgi:hypothetical protein
MADDHMSVRVRGWRLEAKVLRGSWTRNIHLRKSVRH